MTDTDDSRPLLANGEAALSAAEHATRLGLPTRSMRCPSCGEDRECQVLPDEPDTDDALEPYECLTCGHEFASRPV